MTAVPARRSRSAPLCAAAVAWAALASLALAIPPLAAPAAAAPGASAERIPLDIVVVLDNSGSMKKNDPKRLTRDVVTRLANAVGWDADYDARVGVVIFDGRARLVQPLVRADSSGVESIANALRRLDYRGRFTNSAVGVERALYELQTKARPGAQRAIVFLSDGVVDTGDAAQDREVARWLREDLARESDEAGIRIFGVAFTDAADFGLIQALAVRTHGRYYRAASPAALSGVVDQMLVHVDELARREGGDAPRIEAAESAQDRVREAAREAAREVVRMVDGAGPPAGLGAALPHVAAAVPDRMRNLRLALAVLAFVLLVGVGVGVWNGSGGPKGRGLRVAGSSPAFLPAAPAAQLVDVNGRIRGPGVPLALCRQRTRIGRGVDNDIVIPDEAISGLHATIDFRDGDFWLEDRRSTNGTRLEGRPLEPHVPEKLEPGDRLMLAGFELLFAMPDFAPSESTVFQMAPLGGVAWRGTGALHDASQRSGVEVHENPGAGDADDLALFHECLDAHLARVAAMNPELGDFIEKRFEPDMRGALAVTARELMREARAAQHTAVRQYARERVLYVSCAVPAPLTEAAAHFARDWGGFTRLVSAFLQCEGFQQSGCDVLVVVTYGRGDEPWLGLSIVTAEGNDTPIDLMSFEFLSDEERRSLESLGTLPSA